MATNTHIVLADPSIGVREVQQRTTEAAIAAGDIDFNDGNTQSGETVTHFRALGVGAVFQAMTLISTGVAKLPLNRYTVSRTEGDPEPQREIDPRHPVQMCINRRLRRGREDLEYPVAPLSAYHGWQQLTADGCLWGNGYAWIARRTWEMMPLMPNLTCFDSNTGLYRTIVNGQTVWLFPSEVFHFKFPTVTPNSFGPHYPSFVSEGLDMVLAAREAIGNALASTTFRGSLFKHGLKAGGILHLPEGMSKPARDKIEKGFQQRQADPNSWFRTVVLRERATYEQTTMEQAIQSAGDLTDDDIRDIARFYNMHPSDLGLDDDSGYNVEIERRRRFHERTLMPHLESITAECWLKLTEEGERRLDRVDFEHDASALLRLDPLQQAQADNQDVQSGVLSRQDVRDRRKLPRVDGLDEYLVPLNMGVVGQEPAPAPAPAEPLPEEVERTHRLRRVVFEMGRMARHKAGSVDTFVSWVDDGMEHNQRRYRELLGEDPAEWVGPILQRFREMLEVTTPDGLPAAVEQYASELEKGV